MEDFFPSAIAAQFNGSAGSPGHLLHASPDNNPHVRSLHAVVKGPLGGEADHRAQAHDPLRIEVHPSSLGGACDEACVRQDLRRRLRQLSCRRTGPALAAAARRRRGVAARGGVRVGRPRSVAAGLRAAAGEGGPYPAAERGRPVPRHAAQQRAHHGQRCPMGGCAGADAARRRLRRTGRCEPAAGRRPAGSDHPVPSFHPIGHLCPA